MATIRIGVISDTHIPTRAHHLPPEIFTGLAGVDMILHAGDIVKPDVLIELSALAPVHAVYGNMDPHPLRQQLPHKRIITAGQVRIGLTHGEGRGLSTPERAWLVFAEDQVNVVVFGHSHQPMCEWRGNCLLFNPGSPTDRRFCPQFSYGILTVSGKDVAGEIHYFGP